MTFGYPRQNQIVRTWADYSAPTGEGSMYETEDGRVWKSVLTTPQITGVSYGKLRGNSIEES